SRMREKLQARRDTDRKTHASRRKERQASDRCWQPQDPEAVYAAPSPAAQSVPRKAPICAGAAPGFLPVRRAESLLQDMRTRRWSSRAGNLECNSQVEDRADCDREKT